MLGMGFVLEPEEAAEWIATDPRNAEVLFPYLNGEDLNSRPDASASRWVIDFNDRTEAEAATYRLPFARVLETVKPEREAKPTAVSSAPWWKFLRRRGEMRRAIEGMSEVLVIARVSKTVMPIRVQTGQVFHEKLVVFAESRLSSLATLSSSAHQLWAIKYGTTMRVDPTYTPDATFSTFPSPPPSPALEESGLRLDRERSEIMRRRRLGLTQIYNLVNDPDVNRDDDVDRLREIHVSLDAVVMAAYGWGDIPLNHDFHVYRQMKRWTLNPGARAEVLDRLLAENRSRAA